MRRIVAKKKVPASIRRIEIKPGDGPRAAKKRAGVVRFYLQGSMLVNTTSKFNPATVIESLEAGLPIRELDELRSSLDLPMEKLAPMLGISKATLHRRKAAGRLDTLESDRVVRFARLLGQAVTVLESEEYARQWLSSPQFGLGGAVPLKYARTEVGAREVENLLGRIEYGVYS
jgi:putative toxin-antitoxin system antitoxin component (TIGR02293 family)